MRQPHFFLRHLRTLAASLCILLSGIAFNLSAQADSFRLAGAVWISLPEDASDGFIGWAYIDGLGWGYFSPYDKDGSWVWIEGVWYWTSEESSPYFFSTELDGWTYNESGTEWLVEMASGSWFRVEEQRPFTSTIAAETADSSSGSSEVAIDSGGSGIVIGEPRGGGGGGRQPADGVLTAGAFDDLDDQSGAFTILTDKVLQADPVGDWPQVTPPITLQVLGSDGRPVAGATLHVKSQETHVVTTGRDGMATFSPGHDLKRQDSYTVEAWFGAAEGSPNATLNNARSDQNTWSIQLTDLAPTLSNKLDLGFLIDATGSMGDEMAFVKAEVQGIVDDIRHAYPQTEIRIGYVVYRDHGDEYVTRGSAFTSDVSAFQQALAMERAEGGGDFPEAVPEGLAAAEQLAWSSNGAAQVLFWIADAPSHDADAKTAFGEVDKLRARGIAIYPVASSGVDTRSEYLMRSTALLTSSEYLFLTDDSGVGNTHAEPSIPAYDVLLLKDQMLRVLAEEITGQDIQPSENQILRSVGN